LFWNSSFSFSDSNFCGSKVTKLDGCPYCHRLDHEREKLTPEQLTKFEEHKSVCQQQQQFKQYILQAIAGFFLFFIFYLFFFNLIFLDGSISKGMVITMDFSKFDLSAKCESLECHILVMRFETSLYEVAHPDLRGESPVY
jgi:hypothetical protein